MGNAGDGQIDALACQELQRTQFVPGARDRDRFIERITAHHFELAQHRGAVKGNGGANAGDHCIIMRQLPAFIVHRGRLRVDIHVARQGVEDLDNMTSPHSGFTQPLAGPQRSIPG